MKTEGLNFIDLVNILDKHGYKSIAELERFPPNPLKWRKNHWDFAMDVLAAGLKCSRKKVREQFKTPGQILLVFNEILRKTGLLIELQQIHKISEKEFAAKLDSGKWDEEWVNE